MTRSTRLGLVLGLNVGLVVLEAVFGLGARSLALLSDAAHNLADVAAIAISLVAVRYARRSPTQARSFGYHRGTILAAIANAAGILVIAGAIIAAAARRLAHPTSVAGGTVVVVALGAFVLNAVAGALLHEGHDHGVRDLNMRAAFVHMGGDALASLGTAGAGLVIMVTGRFERLDPVVSVLVAALISIEAFRLVRQASDVLLESTPGDLDVSALSEAMATVAGVDSVHDLHVWSLSSEVRALSAHLVLTGHPSLEEAQVVGERVKRSISGPFAIAHSTLELECESCVDDAGDPCGIEAAPAAGHRFHPAAD